MYISTMQQVDPGHKITVFFLAFLEEVSNIKLQLEDKEKILGRLSF
jgi:hypothetical protein